MILLTAVIAGFAAGLIRAAVGKRTLRPLQLKLEWLVPVAFLPQLIAFQIPYTKHLVSDDWARVALVSSQALLLIFALANWKAPGFWALGLGLLGNLVVIVANRGLMPISPEVVGKYLKDGWQIGQRLGTEKDIILPVHQTNLWFLSDRFTLPDWIPYHVAFSLGDILIAIGAFLLLWSLGAPEERQETT